MARLLSLGSRPSPDRRSDDGQFEHGGGHLSSRKAALVAKRGLDLSLVLSALLVFLPVILALVAVLALAQGRPIFIRHHRVGRGGSLFPCLKFRTMVVNGDEVLKTHLLADEGAAVEWEATRKLKRDPRVTRIGRILRKTSVDELPQLVNVLRGDMSLVGPRPIVLDETRHYGARLPLYHSVRPGLTGLWQVSGRSDVSYEHRVSLDSDYVSRWSLARDIWILARTVPAVLASRGSY